MKRKTTGVKQETMNLKPNSNEQSPEPTFQRSFTYKTLIPHLWKRLQDVKLN